MRKRPGPTIKTPNSGHAELQLLHSGGQYCLEWQELIGNFQTTKALNSEQKVRRFVNNGW